MTGPIHTTASIQIALATVLTTLADPVVARTDDALELLFPVDCEIGQDCWIFSHMDLDSSDFTYRDHRCGYRTYEGHEGTDIAPVDPDMRLPVIAAADGLVTGWRDGLDDTPMQGIDPNREGLECGNGVRLEHDGGWVTQYCHMQQGSVTVRDGIPVQTGELLGYTGGSGWAEIPHLHFRVERNGDPVDPFTGKVAANPFHCEIPAPDRSDATLWRNPGPLADYTPTILQRAGLTVDIPEMARAVHGVYPETAPAASPALVGYVVLLGALSGTQVDTTITDPDGQVFFRNRSTIGENRARYFTYAGKPRKDEVWKSGFYRAEFIVSGTSPTGPFRLVREAEIKLE